MAKDTVKIDKKEARIAHIEDDEPFYSESNLKKLERLIHDVRSGKVNLVEHELIDE